MTISLVIVLVALLLTVAMWKQVQKLDLAILREEGEFRTNVTFAMPVFLLLAIILFAYVSFSHPVSINFGQQNVDVGDNIASKKAEDDGGSLKPPTKAGSGARVAGYTPSPDEVLKTVQAINALKATAGQLQTALVNGGDISSVGDQISRIERISFALTSVGYSLTNAEFTPEEVTRCRAAISGDLQLDGKCRRYQQLTREALP